MYAIAFEEFIKKYEQSQKDVKAVYANIKKFEAGGNNVHKPKTKHRQT